MRQRSPEWRVDQRKEDEEVREEGKDDEHRNKAQNRNEKSAKGLEL